MEVKIQQRVNGIKTTIKSKKSKGTIEQYIDENELTHIISEVKKKKGNKVIIERKEWIL